MGKYVRLRWDSPELRDWLARRLIALVCETAFAGLRRAELRWLRLTEYDGYTLTVRQSIWKKHVGPPKGKSADGQYQ
jgi:hypothetical protein